MENLIPPRASPRCSSLTLCGFSFSFTHLLSSLAPTTPTPLSRRSVISPPSSSLLRSLSLTHWEITQAPPLYRLIFLSFGVFCYTPTGPQETTHSVPRTQTSICRRRTALPPSSWNPPLLCLLASEQIAYSALPLPRLSSSMSPGSQASIFCGFLSCGPCAPSFTLKGNLREDA